MQLIYIIPIALGSILAFFLLLGLFMRLRAFSLKGTAAPSLAGYAGRLLKESSTALLYFYTPNCGACGEMNTVVERLSTRNPNVLTVDISTDMETAKKFKIMATPTLVTVQKGIIRNILIGPQSTATVEAQLN
ncbi:MAG: thioredoxin family protein [Deltaproteobacteria bacterium]|nr:thioredoxin family protein [Deltaproteobacteria bacterium]